MGAGLWAPWLRAQLPPGGRLQCRVVECVQQLCHHPAATTNAATPSAQPPAQLESELAAAGLLGPDARPLEFGDLNALAYLNAVLKEAMRLHPVASVGSVRWVCSGSWGLGNLTAVQEHATPHSTRAPWRAETHTGAGVCPL